MSIFLSDFHVVRPKYEASQEVLLEWISNAHKKQGGEVREKLMAVGLGPGKIEKRGSQISDWQHEKWEDMTIYNLEHAPEGYHLDRRMDFYNEAADGVFEELFEEDFRFAPHLIHCTCTGYVAPSSAQKMVSKRGIGDEVTVTHAYHMGCYAAIPAIRMARGHYAAEGASSDIVHTEFCSIHMNPNLHGIDQLVAQSLFADGFIRYRVGERGVGPGFEVKAIREEVVEASTGDMTWTCHNWGFLMSLAKEIPVRLRRALPTYLERLADGRDLSKAVFAIHPGGPKIIDQIADQLSLEEHQVEHSRTILANCGNMSSGTIPHVWDLIARDEGVPDGQLIVGLAFGPGLSISGVILEKVCSS